MTAAPCYDITPAAGRPTPTELTRILEGWLWDVRRKAGPRRGDGASGTWRLAFAVPAHLLAPFEDALCEAAEAVLTNEIPPGRLWRVEALFPAAPDAEFWRWRIAEIAAAEGLAPPALEVTPLPEVDWVAESLKALPPVRVGRLFVHGSHDAHRVPPGALAIRIEAGRAFGTGQHETTLGCLMALDMLARRTRFRRIVDLGAGSGILSLAAARLWRVPVVASDVDEEAVRTARANARMNGLAAWTRFVQAAGLTHPALRAGAPYDLIVANILAGPLIGLAGAIKGVTKSGAVVVLSGILTRQERQVLAPYRSLGFVLCRRIRLGEWPTLILRRPTAARG